MLPWLQTNNPATSLLYTSKQAIFCLCTPENKRTQKYFLRFCDVTLPHIFFLFCQVHVMERLHWNSQSSQPWSWTVIACQIRVQSPLVTPVKLYTQETWLLISLSITHHHAPCVGGQGRSTYPLWYDWLGQLPAGYGYRGLLRVCPAEIAMLRSENLSRTTGMPVSCTICVSNIGRGVKRDCWFPHTIFIDENYFITVLEATIGHKILLVWCFSQWWWGGWWNGLAALCWHVDQMLLICWFIVDCHSNSEQQSRSYPMHCGVDVLLARCKGYSRLYRHDMARNILEVTQPGCSPNLSGTFINLERF